MDHTVTPILAGELAGYRWDTRASERGEDKPVKEDDHSVDALRYAKNFEETVETVGDNQNPRRNNVPSLAWMDNLAQNLASAKNR